ncbi:MAG: hypothetical protein AAGG54_00710 [Pseudomonadota bacterium]
MSLEPLVSLVQQTPASVLTKDALVLVHLIALAVGIGTVLRTDLAILRGLRRPFTHADFDCVARAHHTISRALWVLWFSGLALFFLKTGGDPSEASAKLMAKLATVSFLTVTAMIFSDVGLPILRAQVGQPLVALSLRHRCALAILAGLSVGGWSTSLILGGAATTQTAEWSGLAVLMACTHGCSVTCALTAACIVPLLFGQSAAIGGNNVEPMRPRHPTQDSVIRIDRAA